MQVQTGIALLWEPITIHGVQVLSEGFGESAQNSTGSEPFSAQINGRSRLLALSPANTHLMKGLGPSQDWARETMATEGYAYMNFGFVPRQYFFLHANSFGVQKTFLTWPFSFSLLGLCFAQSFGKNCNALLCVHVCACVRATALYLMESERLNWKQLLEILL